MRNYCYILLMTLLLPGCVATKKQVSTRETSSRDSSFSSKEVSVSRNDSTSTVQVFRDTAIGFSEKVVEQMFNIEDLQPVFNAAGKPVEREQTFEGTGKNKGIKGTVKVTADGKIRIECKADSLTKIVEGLSSVLIYERAQVDSLSKEVEKRNVSTSTTSTSITTKVKSFWASNWHWLSALIIAAIIFVLRKLKVI